MSTAYQITTIHGRNSMAKALAGEAPLPAIAGIAFGIGGHNPNQPQNGIELPSNQEDLNNRIIILPVEEVSFPEDGVVRFRVNIEHGTIPGNYFSEVAIVDDGGKAFAIQTFGMKSINSNDRFIYDWEEVM